jgi:hypothetical protein
MQTMRRPLNRRWGLTHHGDGWQAGRLIRGSTPAMSPGPAGMTGPVPGTDLGFQGMDPSNPVTWVRPYRPQPGMIAYLNYDGARPNRTQTV